MDLLATFAKVGLTLVAASSPIHYRIEVVRVSNPQSGGASGTTVTTTAFISVSTSDSAGGQVVRIEVDSGRTQTVPYLRLLDGPAGHLAAGTVVVGFTRNGLLLSPLRSSVKSLSMDALLEGAAFLFTQPTLQRSLNEHWTDSTTLPRDEGGMETIKKSWTLTSTENHESRSEAAMSRRVDGGPYPTDDGVGTALMLAAPDGTLRSVHAELQYTIQMQSVKTHAVHTISIEKV